MNLYLVTQDENVGYDTYDSFICTAETAKKAREMLPSEYAGWGGKYDAWCSSPKKATSTFIRKAKRGMKAGVILASFNAG